ncbi:bactofilin family protein [Paracidovorax oryzae]|uniref:bactofilin family protein n=1 Tax=Paracidovorax oryzae TaxID=862720 RepID=UPI002586FC91
MAVQNPFFGKREPESFQPRPPSSVLGGSGGAVNSAASTATTTQPAAQKPAASVPSEGAGSKLTVGPNIKLKGVEITDCDTLVVEGTVEATMDSRVIQIAEQGAFRGSAEIDIAEIHGEFDGTLTVRQKLVIYSTGKVNGKIRYGKVVIEEGGQLAGEIESGTVGSVRSQSHAAANVSRGEAQQLAA